MKIIEPLYFNMCATLEYLNKFFVKNDIMTKKEFMDIQLNTWKEIKKTYGIKIKETDK